MMKLSGMSGARRAVATSISKWLENFECCSDPWDEEYDQSDVCCPGWDTGVCGVQGNGCRLDDDARPRMQAAAADSCE